MNIPIRNVYYLLCYGWDHLDESDLVDRDSLGRLDRVQDLLGKVLAEGTFRLVRRGIDRGYREVTAEVAGVRGKLEIGAMATTAVRARSRTICTYEEFSPDILHNQILRSTLDSLRRAGSHDPNVQRDVELAYQKLDGISVVKLTPRTFRRVQLSRNQRIYHFLLSVCQLVQDSLLVDERTGASRFYDFRQDENRMWKLFEDFALAFFRIELDGLFAVQGQRRVPWDAAGGRTPADEDFLPAMYPDIVLESAHRRIILDTKFYRSPLSQWQGSTKIRSDNLYQLLAYLENRQGTWPTGPRHEGILLYAAVDRTFRADVVIREFRIQARTVNLSRPWPDIHQEMLDVVGREGPTEATELQ
jgi:5-methylcytosine-specific restriction enzyme subunit McrC